MRATLIARRVGAAFSLVHVVDSDQSRPMIEAEREAAVTLLARTAETIEANEGLTVDAHVNVDDVSSGILRAAEEVGAQLVIIGPHRKRLRDIFTGTTAERMVRRSPLPLLVAVRTPSATYERALLALDFDEASKSAARTAIGMGIFEHLVVIVMHAFDAPARSMMMRAMERTDTIENYVADERRRAAEKLKALGTEIGLPPAHHRLVAIEGSPARSIIEAAHQEDAGLIVLGANVRKGFERLLIGSVTEDVLRDAQRDILIVPVDGELA